MPEFNLKRFFLAALLIVGFVVPCFSLHAEEAGGLASAVKRTGLPLPRFASLKSGEVNMRTGPGMRYPIEWRYQRKALPIEITAEFDTWRRIRDMEGTEGWVHQSNVSGKRTFVVLPPKDNKTAVQPIYRKADVLSPLRAQAEPGFIGKLLECKDEWCRVDADGQKGYMKKDAFWGAYAEEKFD